MPKQSVIETDPWIVVVREQAYEDGARVYFARDPGLLGCSAQGDTLDEAIAELAEVRKFHVAHRAKHGLPLPARPEPATNRSVTYCPVRIVVTLPAESPTIPEAQPKEVEFSDGFGVYSPEVRPAMPKTGAVNLTYA